MRFRRDRVVPAVVTSVEDQTAQAAALARIAGQERLLDPRLNPATRTYADRLLVEQHHKALDAGHARLLRRHRVADRRAADAEKTLEVIRAAKQMSSPARSVLALHKGRTRFLGLSMAASLSLSVGSAMGVASLADQHGAGSTVGYLAEIGLTGLSTMAIMYRSHLGEHGTPVERGSRQDKVLWALTIIPLLAGITANALAHGMVGVFCSIGAAAFATLAHLIADQSSAALRSRAERVTDVDEAALERSAMGDDLFTAVQAEPTGPQELTEAEREAEALDAGFAAGWPDPLAGQADQEPAASGLFTDEALAAWLNGGDPPAEGPVPAGSSPDTDGPQDAAKPVPAGETTIHPRGRIETDQPVDGSADGSGGVAVPPRVESAAAARRAAGEQTRARIAAYMAAHPNATKAEIAAALGLHPDTVKRYRRDIRRTARMEAQ